MTSGDGSAQLNIPDVLPVLPLRGGLVILPLSVTTLVVGQPRSIQLIDEVMRRDRLLVLVASRTDKDHPTPDDLHRVGSAAVIHQLARLPDGTLRVVIQGLERVRIVDFTATEPYFVARVQLAPDHATPGIEVEGLRALWSSSSAGSLSWSKRSPGKQPPRPRRCPAYARWRT